MSFISKYSVTCVLCGVVLLRLLDSYQNHNSVFELLGYSSGFFLAWFFAFVVFARLLGKIIFPKRFVPIILLSGAVLAIISVIAAVINFQNYENYIYSLTRIHIDQLFILGLFLFFTGFLSLPSKFFKIHYKKLIFTTGILLFVLYYMYGYFPLDARHQIAKEDNLIENFQVIFLFLSSVFSALISRTYFPKQKMLGGLFLFLALGLLFTAGDEISWGQRIFNVQSPEYFLETNAQQEVTLHNQKSVHGEIPFVFAVVGAYGAFGFLGVKLFPQFLKKHKKFLVVIPEWFVFPFFFAGFAYNFYTKLGEHRIGNYSEPTELMLYLGVFFYVYVLYHNLKPLKKH